MISCVFHLFSYVLHVLSRILSLPRSWHPNCFCRDQLDTFIGLVVLLNSLCMVLELECEGQLAGEKLGLTEQIHCLSVLIGGCHIR